MSPGKRKKRKEGPGGASKLAFKEMTVAHVREPATAEFAEVMFLESARIYKLVKKNSRYEEMVKRLREAIAKGCVVRVRLDQPHGGTIEDVEAGG